MADSQGNRGLPSFTLSNADSVYGTTVSKKISDRIRISKASDEIMLPAIVKTYDPTTHVITVSVPITYLTSSRNPDGSYVTQERADVTTTAWTPSCGGITMFLPYSEGDVGWIEAADRDTDSFKDSDMTQTVVPNTFFLRNFRFSRFIPDIMKEKVVSESDAGSLVIQNDDGSIKMKINKESGIEITSSNVPVQINANVIVNGTIRATDFIANNVSYKSHVHSNGAGQTGAPYNP